MDMTCGETILRDRAKEKMGRTVTIGRVAILTQKHNGRAACHYCGPCEQGCITTSYFASPGTTIADALKTGRLTLLTDAVAARIPMKDGKATGVMYVDRVTRQVKEIRAKVVVLCASTLESTRLLLNFRNLQQQRRARPLRDGSSLSGRSFGNHADARSTSLGGSPTPSQRHLRPALPQREGVDHQRQTKVRIDVPRRLRNTNRQPENGSDWRFSWHKRASESIPFLPSTASIAIKMRICGVI